MRNVNPYLLVWLLLAAAAEGCSTGHVISFNDHGIGGTGRIASNAPARPNLNIGQNARVAGLYSWDPGGTDPFHPVEPTPSPSPGPVPDPTPPPVQPPEPPHWHWPWPWPPNWHWPWSPPTTHHPPPKK